jgi:hypothetical protein
VQQVLRVFRACRVARCVRGAARCSRHGFGARGDGLYGYDVVKNEGGKAVFIKQVDFAVE